MDHIRASAGRPRSSDNRRGPLMSVATTGSALNRGAFDAASGVLLAWPRVKFIPMPDATSYDPRSQQRRIVAFWNVDPRNVSESDAFVRDHWRSVVKAFNVRRNNSIKCTRDLVQGEYVVSWGLFVSCVV